MPQAVAIAVAAGILICSVLVHELAHFWAAKRVGMLCTELSLGFGRRLCGVTWRGTRLSLRLLPLGGLAHIEGMTHRTAAALAPELRPLAYINRPPLARAFVVLAGPVANLLMFWLCLTVMAALLAPSWKWVLLAPLVGILLAFTFVHATLASLKGVGDLHSVLVLPAQIQHGWTAFGAGGGRGSLIIFAFVVPAAINLSLSVVNLLPLAPLDGSHAALAVIDAIKRHRERFGAATPALDFGSGWPHWWARSTSTVLVAGAAFLVLRDIWEF